MMMAITYFSIVAAGILLIPFIRVKWKGIITVSVVIVNAVLAGWLAVKVLTGKQFDFIFYGTPVTGDIAVRIDALSAWFILLINFTLVTGALYGLQYMKS